MMIGRRSGGVLLLMMLAVLWLAAGAPANWLDGLSWLLVGSWAVLYPAARPLARWELGLAVAWLLFSLACFLPDAGLAGAGWRSGLAEAGIDVGHQVTPQPVAALWAWAGFVARGFLVMRILAEGSGDRSRRRGLIVFSLLVLVYLVLAWCRHLAAGANSGEVFGFFPNRNHTATLLAMGVAAGAGLLLDGLRARSRRLIGLGLAALLLPACGLIFISVSRAGIALLAGGLVAVVVLTGRYSRRGAGLKAMLLVAAGLCMLLWLAPSPSRDRLVRTAGAVAEDSADGGGEPLDGRIGIHRDAVDMILDHPLAGWGAGQFETVFPQYRRLSSPVNDAAATHPESSWLWVAAEFGVPAAVCLVLLFVCQVAPAWRCLRRRADRGIRSGSLVAGCIPFVHSLVDVPLHCDSLLWVGGLLLSLARDEPQVACGRWIERGWRLGAAVIAVSGVLLLAGAHRGMVFRPVDVADVAVADARDSYLRSRQELGEGSPPESRDAGARRLDQAVERLDHAIRQRPMDARLHGLRAMINLNFDDRDDRSKADFLRQRLLDPGWIRLRLLQADCWKPIDRRETLRLWTEALELAVHQDGVSGSGPSVEGRIFRSVVSSAAGDDELEKSCLLLASGQLDRLTVFCGTLRKDRLRRILPELEEELKRTPGSEQLLEGLPAGRNEPAERR